MAIYNSLSTFSNKKLYIVKVNSHIINFYRVFIIDQKSFNEEMSRYLDTVKRDRSESVKSKFQFFKKQELEEVPEMGENEVHIEYKEPSFFKKLLRWKRRYKLDELEEDLTDEEKLKLEEIEGEIEALEDEESDLEAMEEDVEERKEGFLSTLSRMINVFKKEHDHSDEDFDEDFMDEPSTPELDEDVKEILKITHSWLEKLPVRQKKLFKDSNDFERYKELLAKHGLIKMAPVVEEPQDDNKIKNKPRTIIKK